MTINELAGCSDIKHSGTCLNIKEMDLNLKYHLLGEKRTLLLHIVVKELRVYKNGFESSKSYFNKSVKSMILSKILCSEKNIF